VLYRHEYRKVLYNIVMPEAVTTILIALAAIVGAGWVLICAVGAMSIRSLATGRLNPLPPDQEDGLYQRASELVDPKWAEDEGFARAGCYQLVTSMMSTKVVGWRHAGGSLFMCVYLHDATVPAFDIVTEFNNDVGLTTSSTRDGHLIPPRQGHYLQSFSNKSVTECYALHLQAELDVQANTDAKPLDTARPLADAMIEALQKQVSHTRSLVLWFARFPIWYFGRRHSRHNKTVAQLQGWAS